MKRTQLSPELQSAWEQIDGYAKGYGLDYFPIIYEVLDYETLYAVAAMGGFPIRYPHWRFGMEYNQLYKGYTYGLSVIYEMVINTNPSYAYLLEGNEMVTQKMVMAHVTAHVDFFKNNMWFVMRITPEHGVIEIGSILWGPAIAGTRVATEALYLFARHTFDELGYRRFEWKCNALNEPSRRAALRFGFAFEGIFRQHMVLKGESRDTAWYAMTDGDWPAARHGFERWLDPGNFDATGRQRMRIADCRAPVP